MTPQEKTELLERAIAIAESVSAKLDDLYLEHCKAVKELR